MQSTSPRRCVINTCVSSAVHSGASGAAPLTSTRRVLVSSKSASASTASTTCSSVCVRPSCSSIEERTCSPRAKAAPSQSGASSCRSCITRGARARPGSPVVVSRPSSTPLTSARKASSEVRIELSEPTSPISSACRSPCRSAIGSTPVRSAHSSANGIDDAPVRPTRATIALLALAWRKVAALAVSRASPPTPRSVASSRKSCSSLFSSRLAARLVVMAWTLWPPARSAFETVACTRCPAARARTAGSLLHDERRISCTCLVQPFWSLRSSPYGSPSAVEEGRSLYACCSSARPYRWPSSSPMPPSEGRSTPFIETAGSLTGICSAVSSVLPSSRK
mmetsp:Transcript_6044/g.19466  ORF Transcript_6044/g.19466 Transcript_6044/m.19466 type:complete len:337 (-) Transcript_6044:58-1068(-)